MHTTNTIEFILEFIRFYVPCSSTLIMEEYETLSCVCGYHEYQRVWMARSGWRPNLMVEVGEELRCERERPRNPMDPYAVVVKKDGITVGKSTW